jgi:hypothetical protein
MSTFIAFAVLSICVASTSGFLTQGKLVSRPKSCAMSTPTSTDEYQDVIETVRTKMAANPMAGQMKEMMSTFLDDYARYESLSCFALCCRSTRFPIHV